MRQPSHSDALGSKIETYQLKLYRRKPERATNVMKREEKRRIRQFSERNEIKSIFSGDLHSVASVEREGVR